MSLPKHSQDGLLDSSTLQHSKHDVLFAQIRYWDSMIQHATEERTNRPHHANGLQSIVHHTPDEIFGVIFEFACPPIDLTTRPFAEDPFINDEAVHEDDWPKRSREMEDMSYRHFPVTLGAVSRHWRRIAWSTPRLWTSLAVELSYKNVYNQAERLDLYLTNSKGLHFALDLDIRKRQEEIEDTNVAKEIIPLTAFERIIFGDMASKIRVLRIVDAPSDWVPQISRHFCHLVELSLGWDISQLVVNPGFQLIGFNSLRHLCLVQSPSVSTKGISLSNLTSIHLTSTRLETQVSLLLQRPLIVESNCYQIPFHTTAQNIPDTLTRPFILPTLKKFGWVHVQSTWNDALLRNIRLPNLEHLQWSGSSGWEAGGREAVVVFFSNLPQNLDSFAIDNSATFGAFLSTPRETQYANMLQSLPNVRKLSLISPQRCFVHDMFQMLIGYSGNEPDYPVIFPKLNCIRICRLLRDWFDNGNYDQELRELFKNGYGGDGDVDYGVGGNGDEVENDDSVHGNEAISHEETDSGSSNDDSDMDNDIDGEFVSLADAEHGAMNSDFEGRDIHGAENHDDCEQLITLYPGLFLVLAFNRNRMMNLASLRLELPRCKLERSEEVMGPIRNLIEATNMTIEVVEDSQILDWIKEEVRFHVLRPILYQCKAYIDFYLKGLWSREVEDLSYRHFPVVLGAVSREWRNVAWSTPRLWTSLAIEPNYKNVKNQATRLELYLQNCRGRGFTLDLDFRRRVVEEKYVSECGTESIQRLNPLENVIFGNMAPRITVIRLVDLPDDWLPRVSEGLSHVLELSVARQTPKIVMTVPFKLEHFASLRHLEIIELAPCSLLGQPPYQLPCTLTSVHLNSGLLETHVTILPECPYLVEYIVQFEDAHYYVPGTTSPPRALTRPLVLPHMRRFDSEERAEDFCMEELRSIYKDGPFEDDDEEEQIVTLYPALRFELPHCKVERCSQIMEEVIVPKVMHEVESLILVNFSTSSAAGISEETYFNKLVNLAVVNDDDRELEYFFMPFAPPSFRYFALRASPEWSEIEPDLPWPDIKQIELREAPVHIALELLHDCESLHSFRARTAEHWDYIGDEFLLDEPLTPNELSFFQWPTLEELVVHYGNHEDDLWAEFFNTLRVGSIQSLSFHEFKPDTRSESLYAIPYLVLEDVKNLTLYGCDPSFTDAIMAGLVFWLKGDKMDGSNDDPTARESIRDFLHLDERSLRKVNAARATTRRLPFELLSAIFQLLRPPIDFRLRRLDEESSNKSNGRRPTCNQDKNFHFTLATVCYYWRQVVWGTPYLWTTFSVEIREDFLESNIPIINIYFENAGNVGVILELDMSLMEKLEDAQERLQLEVLSRLESIRECIFVDNSGTGPSGKRVYLAVKLTLDWSWEYSMDHVTEHELLWLLKLPALRRISIENVAHPFTLSWSMITHAHLRFIPTTQCFYVFAKCPNLVEFHCVNPPIMSPPYSISPQLQDLLSDILEPIVHRHLEQLTWSIFDDEVARLFLSYVRFTKLRYLCWNDGQRGLEDVSIQKYALCHTFISSLPPTIESLDLIGSPPSSRLITLFLNRTPALAELYLGNCSCRLVPDDSDAEEWIPVTPNKIVASSLRSIQGHDINRFDNPHPELVAEMLEGLYGAREDREPFKLTLELNEQYHEAYLSRLRALVATGFYLDITLGNRHLDLSN
ncbi:hypothetical protein NP233_g7770 [Leucocoprinus birnbaumii]|uniref:F-box domain-containing protein n=1 Tax=Leucocoprinus birnbaumii TaxID=56174 RepID=A0AAD5VRY9_9AGAR|nr:hypothetical protein NP233_g7770 [Leucocoprinus birnbaumii]